MSCKVITNRHGILTFRIYFEGREYWKSTGKPDTPANREELEELAKIISRGIKNKTFSLEWFQEEARAEKPNNKTIGGYYVEWIERKKPPVVRAGLERDYREHFNRYILPKFKNVALVDVTPRKLDEFRAYLLNERGLSLKSCRNIIDASFRACIRDARKIDYLLDRDPFEALMWPRRQTPKPDPFTEDERDSIIAAFANKSPFYVPFTHTLFWTGARPSELLALKWGDVDLRAGFMTISKSRYIGEEATKTMGSDRAVKLIASVVEVLKRLKPLATTENDYVFLNQEGEPLNFHTWRAGV
jgi:integrase